MNIDSYTRLNPYYGDDQDEKVELRRDGTAIVALGVLVVLGAVFVLVWSRT